MSIWNPIPSLVILGFSLQASALEIELRYHLDESGFFDNPAARKALRAAADVYEDLIIDGLGPIDAALFPPRDGEPERFWVPTYREIDETTRELDPPEGTDLVVPEDTIIIYAAGRSLSGDTRGRGGPGGIREQNGLSAEFAPFVWANQVYSRGEPGGLRLRGDLSFNVGEVSDFAPWGGVVFFDDDGSTNWNFSISEPGAWDEDNFVSIALHEIGHVLGFGITGNPAVPWNNLISGTFQGPTALESLGGGGLFLTSDATHWHGVTPANRTLGVFGREHGSSQPPLMLVLVPDPVEQFAVITDLDIAALQDLGWEVAPFSPGSRPALDLSGTMPRLRVATITGYDYEILRSPSLGTFVGIGSVAGNGGTLEWEDTSGFGPSAFYIVESSEPPASSGERPDLSGRKGTKVGSVLMKPRGTKTSMISCGVCEAGSHHDSHRIEPGE